MTGSGMPAFIGDLAIEGSRLVEVGGRVGRARREFKAEGLAVAPGFIDSHTHMDAQVLWDPMVTSSSYHGVTSVVAGNCGLSLAPCKARDRDTLLHTFVRVEGMEMSLLRAAVEWQWTDVPGYLEALDRSQPALNVGVLVGHCALRQFVMGEDSVERPATRDEIDTMRSALRRAMRAGALGFSTNQNPRHIRDDGKPLPSRLAEFAEIEALGAVLGELNRGVVQMSSAPGGADRVERLANFSLLTGRPVIWNAILHSWADPENWRAMLAATEGAFRRGARAWANTNTRAFNNRFTLKDAQEFDEFPTWRALMLGPLEERRKAFRDPEVRARLKWEAVDDPKRGTFHKRWDLVYIVKPVLPKNQEHKGRSVAQLAQRQGKDVLDAFLDLAHGGGAGDRFSNAADKRRSGRRGTDRCQSVYGSRPIRRGRPSGHRCGIRLLHGTSGQFCAGARRFDLGSCDSKTHWDASPNLRHHRSGSAAFGDGCRCGRV